MTSEDDPEARIRELEQPLADAARASEAAANQPPSKWAPPSGAPPPLPYDGSLFGPPAELRARRPIRWIVPALFVIGAMCLPVVIYLFSAHQVSGRGVPAPNLSSPSARPSSAAPTTTATTAPIGGKLSVSGINEVRTVVCRDTAITISGVDNTVTITGHCARLDISGVRNKVTVEAVENIQVSGFNNAVTYRVGAPRVSTSGQNNVVRKG